MRFITKLLIVACSALSTVQVYGSELFEYHGYARVGGGWSERGTSQSCFALDNTWGKPFRLGNECGGLYAELSLVNWIKPSSETVAEPWFKSVFTLALASDLFDTWEATNDEDLVVALREAYIIGGNLLPFEADLWMGKRFYRRYDIHMHDFFIVANTGGRGAGIENIKIGDDSLHLALVQYRGDGDITIGDKTANPPIETTLDARYASGPLEFILIHGQHSAHDSSTGEKLYEGLNGQSLTSIYTMNLKEGFNKIYAQYGRGIYGAKTGDANGFFNFANTGAVVQKEDDITKKVVEESNSYRIANQYVQGFEGYDLAASIIYQGDDFGGYTLTSGKEAANRSLIMVGVRPSYYLSKTWKTTLDLGFVAISDNIVSSNDEKIQKDQQLTKATLALEAVNGKGYWARPSLRYFVTAASWDDDSADSIGGTLGFQNKDNEALTYGFQAEWWW
ncbi:carbohydrate porin [Pseudobacteriovorax antillogorgiicola]|uniref:Maltoporin n=1 Tax=Pseudobacteriovorax antillogorgiicola TaxID=1513793 RepID=A0A1Y6BRY6_9BACT|nr:carbohydrate porin [Pseudobacteriovorax antillogorgiicola]TCS53079.1 maltoporin [Pseudobacteriovorax antillogorgiicola]SMF26142.1 maltoporin [Pseudobacteriovorax antillogorgiicola]